MLEEKDILSSLALYLSLPNSPSHNVPTEVLPILIKI